MQQLKSRRLDIEKLAYSEGINVALHHAERTDTYKDMRSSFENLFNKQAKIIATHEHFDSLMLLAKAAGADLKLQVGVFLANNLATDQIDFAPFLVWGGNQGGQAALDKLSVDGVFGLTNPDIINYFDDYSNLVIDSVDNYSKQWIANQIQDGKNKGLTPQEIADNLVDEAKGFSKVRAERIVLTETAKALITVEIEAAARLGIQEKVWRTSLDDRVDPICLDLEGKVASIRGMFPGGYDGPPAHVGCRCFIEELIPQGWEIPAAQDIWLGE